MIVKEPMTACLKEGSMSSTRYRRVILGLFLVFSVSTLPAFAQVTGSIAGTVRDSSGAVLPGATVTVRGPSLQRESVTVTTSTDGTYRMPLVPPGISRSPWAP